MATGSQNGTAKRQWIISILGAVATLGVSGVSVIWWLSSLGQEVKNLQETSQSHRMEYSARIDGLGKLAVENQKTLREVDSEQKAMESKLQEIETQFCASDIIRNINLANQMREISILHTKVFGQTYPTDNAYYPEICQRHPK